MATSILAAVVSAGRPVLVTGSHRSGTTWVGRMLCLSREAGYIHEPLNRDRRPGWTREPLPYWFVHIDNTNEERYRPLIEDVLAFRYPVLHHAVRIRHPKHLAQVASDAARSLVYRVRGPRPLLKDPFALFAAEWLGREFGMEVIVMIRHPAAFAGSVKRLNWQFKFRSWLEQDALVRGRLAPFAEEMQRQATTDVDIIDQAILMWRVMHSVIDDYRRAHPEWTFVRHEDLAADPVGGFEGLYKQVALTWSPRVADRVAAFSAATNPKEVATWRRRSVRRDSAAARATWRARLSPEEIARIRQGVADVSPAFYSEDEW